jgi:glycosyltransferase involved in cell wall biosynthesis
MDVLMLVISNVAHDARVLREAGALADRGHAVHIVGRDVPAGWSAPDGVTVESVSGGSGLKPAAAGSAPATPAAPRPRGALAGRVRAVGRWALLPQHRRRVWHTWGEGARAAVADRTFDVVHAHDFNVLRLAADLADRGGAKLVYDAHEWWSGRERHGRPTPVERARDKRAERRLVARADAVLTVSDGIAVRLGRWRGAPVAVVRNTFPLIGGPGEREQVPDRPRGVVYAGRIGAARDIETLLSAAADLRLETLLMGNADREFLPKLRAFGATFRIEPARPVDEVDEVLRRVGISMVTLTDTCENHRLALPNKVFHAVRAGVPVVAADLPELRRLVAAYGIGALYRPGDAASLRAALEAVSADYPGLCARARRARAELNWDQDAKELVKVYDALTVAR